MAATWNDYWADLASGDPNATPPGQTQSTGGGDWNQYWADLASGDPNATPPTQPQQLQPYAVAGTNLPINGGTPGNFIPITNPGYMQGETGTGPAGTTPTSYNPYYYADTQTAQAIAQQLGGSVVQGDPFGFAPNSTFTAPQANMIQLPNGTVVDAGQIAQMEANYAQDPVQLQSLLNNYLTGVPQSLTAYQNTLQGYNPAALVQPGAALPKTGGTTNATTNATTNTGLPGVAPSVVAGAGGGNLNTGGTYAPPDTTTPPLTNRTQGGTPLGDPGTGNPAADPGGDGSVPFPGIWGGGYPTVGSPTGYPLGTGAVGGFPVDANGNPSWTYNPSNNVGTMLQNSLGYAYTQGGELIKNYGGLMAQENQRANQLSSLGDSMYAFLQANPGYTPDQAAAIMNQGGLNALQWTPDMANANFLTSTGTVPMLDPTTGQPVLDANGNPMMQSEQAAWLGTPMEAESQYAGYTQPAVNLAVRGLQTGLNAAIDPAQLGLSSQYTTNYNFTPEDMQNIINAAGRKVGEQTMATMDQLQRAAAASGTNAPLALSAALARQAQTGDVAAADAMTQAAIQAKQTYLNTQQALEQMRLASVQDISNREMQAATTSGQANIAAQETMGQEEAQLTQAGEQAAQQRAQAMAQNRQQISQTNQTAQFQRGSYVDTAESQRATQEATAARADQTQARQDVRNEEQTSLNEANSQMAGQLQAFTGVTGAGQASQANVIKAAQLPTTLDKVVGAGTAAVGALGSAEGEVINEPSVRRIGEKGPEIVIKLKHMGSGGPMTYRRRHEAAYA
jgi:hypothetical protein